MSEKLIIENLTKKFGKNEGVENINLSVKEHELLTLLGPSGCGKSTLLKYTWNIRYPTSGSYLFEGKRVDKMNENQLTALRKGSIGFIFQTFNLI